MGASSTNSAAPDTSSAPTLTLSNRFQPLDGLAQDEEPTKPNSKFHAQGVYKPPHMRTPSESMTSITGSDLTADSAFTVRPRHGSNLESEDNTARTPSTDSAAAPVFGFGEMKKKIHDQVVAARKAADDLEMAEKEFLLEEDRYEYGIRMLRSMGYSENEIRKAIGWPITPPSRPQSVKPLDADVGIPPDFFVAERDSPQVQQTVVNDLANVNLSSKREPERPAKTKTREKKGVQQTGEDLVNKTPIPGGPMYSSANRLGDVYQTGKYGHSTPVTAPTNDTQPDTMIQATSWNEQLQAHPVITSLRGPVSSQVPGQIYQTAPVTRFGSSIDSLPPRFRQPPTVHKPDPLNFQNFSQSGPKDTIPVGHPVSWPPVLPQNPAPNNTLRSAPNPPPPRPYFYEVDLVFDFEGVALASDCNRDIFVKTYWKANGFSPSQAAWAAWASVVERIEKAKRAQQYEYQKAIERETKERRGTGSRLTKWSSNLAEDPYGTEQGYTSSSSDASTKVPSSRSSEVGEEGNMVVSLVGSNGRRKAEIQRSQKPWKDVTDKTWAFGEPPRPDDLQHYMTHVVQKSGWQVRDPRLE